jgi:hypothetical protein
MYDNTQRAIAAHLGAFRMYDALPWRVSRRPMNLPFQAVFSRDRATLPLLKSMRMRHA